ncbi:hypothetical protein [Vibrio phage vB_VpaP_SJSY21]|nr:hypothetical protein [Vibrio phage vB_VpaP_SJSY21]
MRIIANDWSVKTTFEKMNPGECFLVNGHLCIKAHDFPDFKAVSLKNGAVFRDVINDTEVETVDAEVSYGQSC